MSLKQLELKKTNAINNKKQLKIDFLKDLLQRSFKIEDCLLELDYITLYDFTATIKLYQNEEMKDNKKTFFEFDIIGHQQDNKIEYRYSHNSKYVRVSNTNNLMLLSKIANVFQTLQDTLEPEVFFKLFLTLNTNLENISE